MFAEAEFNGVGEEEEGEDEEDEYEDDDDEEEDDFEGDGLHENTDGDLPY